MGGWIARGVQRHIVGQQLVETSVQMSMQGGGHHPTPCGTQAGSMHESGLASDLQDEVGVGLGDGVRGPTQARPHQGRALERRVHAQAASGLCRDRQAQRCECRMTFSR